MMLPLPADVWTGYQPGSAQVIVVTGQVGAGKTTWCRDLIAHVRQTGGGVAGLSSPGVFVDEHKVAINLLDIANDEQRRLADRLAVPDDASPTRNWKFHAETLAWGDAVLRSVGICDLLVIDELGPLELLHNQGWQSALPLLKAGRYRVGCVVVRQSLLKAFLAVVPNADVIEVKRE